MNTLIYKKIIKPFLFQFKPDTIHHYAIQCGIFFTKTKVRQTILSKLFKPKIYPQLSQTLHTITFSNPIGLSAGFDKDGDLPLAMQKVGFGFTQVGTTTLHSYSGNPQPWSIRIPKAKSLLVNYGLKNIGIEKLIQKFNNQKTKPTIPMSISVGKTNSPSTASDKNGIIDYTKCLRRIIESNIGDFYTINISCPNTFGGEPFTKPEKLKSLLSSLYTLNIQKPVFLKMPINSPWKEFNQLLQIAKEYNVEGVIIGNLNKNRNNPLIKGVIPDSQKGSFSGLPTRKLCDDLISKTYQNYKDDFTIVGVGGIFTTQDAYEKIKLGASLVQLITGMIYEGPWIIETTKQELTELLKKDGFTNINEAIGSAHKTNT